MIGNDGHNCLAALTKAAETLELPTPTTDEAKMADSVSKTLTESPVFEKIVSSAVSLAQIH